VAPRKDSGNPSDLDEAQCYFLTNRRQADELLILESHFSFSTGAQKGKWGKKSSGHRILSTAYTAKGFNCILLLGFGALSVQPELPETAFQKVRWILSMAVMYSYCCGISSLVSFLVVVGGCGRGICFAFCTICEFFLLAFPGVSCSMFSFLFVFLQSSFLLNFSRCPFLNICIWSLNTEPSDACP
jgi:hypothetical protein